MRARPLRRPSFALLLALLSTLTPALALGGCGKTPLGSASSSAGGAQALASVGPAGAGGLVTKNTVRLGGADPVTDAAAVARAVRPGLTAVTRPPIVTVVDAHGWADALAASVLSSSPLRAPLLYSEGPTLPAVSAEALAAMRPTGLSATGGGASAAGALGDTQIIEVGPDLVPAGSYRVYPVRAGDPFKRAVEIEGLNTIMHGGPPHAVIVVAADGPPALAMPAAGLAAQTGVPILFVTAVGVPAPTREALAQLREPEIYVLGPSTAVSDAVLARLARYGTAKRILATTKTPGARAYASALPSAGAPSASSSVAGATDATATIAQSPVENAIATATFAEESFGWGVREPGHGLVFASATQPLDAPAAAPLSASGDYGPLLLLEGPTQVPAALGEYLRDIQPAYSDAAAYRPVHGSYNHGFLIGDAHAISATAQAELDTMLEISPVSSSSPSP